MYLHGMWASPEDSCGAFEHAATPFGFLVCPRGNTPFGDGRMWTGTYASVAPNVHAALDAAAALAPGKLDRSSGGTLMGYSNGAYFAAEVAQSEPGKWTGVVLLSMQLELDAARLRAAGIRRVVLGAGDKDGTRDSMKALAARTDAAGVPRRDQGFGCADRKPQTTSAQAGAALKVGMCPPPWMVQSSTPTPAGQPWKACTWVSLPASIESMSYV